VDAAQLSIAYTAGALAFLSPCALPLLPTYISYFMERKEEQFRIAQSIYMAISLLGGFLSVFIIIGVIPTFIISEFSRWVWLLTPVIGAMLILLGLITIFTSITERLPRFEIQISGLGEIPFLIYGVAYGAASLGCSLPIFLLVMLQVSSAQSLTDIAYLFISYGLGAATLIIPLTLTLALTKSFIHKWMLNLMPYIKKINGLVLIIAGAYMLFVGLSR
jgi:cytochrome c biogenesis protein CcdA